ncbi:MAG: hypothetical protein ACOC44_04780 [Promethearchaeia archaeon]
MSKISKKQQRKINYTNAGKNLFLMVIVSSVVIYQILWFESAQNISISYDLKEYEIDVPEIKTFDEYLEYLFEYMQSNPINLTNAADRILHENETLIDNIEDELNKTITEVEQIYKAYKNKTLERKFIVDFFELMWHKGIDILIPEGFLEPSFIIISIGGWASVLDISFYGRVLLGNKSALFLENINHILSPNEDLRLEITLKDLIAAIANIAFDLLIDLTIEILENYNEVLETVLSYLNEFLKEFEVSLAFNGKGLVGLLNLKFDLSVDLKSILDELQIESVLP